MTDHAVKRKVIQELPREVNRGDGRREGKSLWGITATIPAGAK